MANAEHTKSFKQIGKVPIAEIDIDFKFQPDLNRKSLNMINKLKQEGNFGKNALDHMYNLDIQNRKLKQKKAFVVEMKSTQIERNRFKINDKSNQMVADKFKQDFQDAFSQLLGMRNMSTL